MTAQVIVIMRGRYVHKSFLIIYYLCTTIHVNNNIKHYNAEQFLEDCQISLSDDTENKTIMSTGKQLAYKS